MKAAGLNSGQPAFSNGAFSSPVSYTHLTSKHGESITPDCGAEFSLYQDVSNALSNVPFYFADPHSPRQRGTNENTNGLLREFLPKGSDFALVLPDTIDRFIFLLNLCPRKCLACRSRLRYFSRRCCT